MSNVPKTRPPYPEEFRRDAVGLVRSGRSIRDVAEKAEQCPVDFKMVTPEQAKAAVEQFMANDAARPRPAVTEAGD